MRRSRGKLCYNCLPKVVTFDNIWPIVVTKTPYLPHLSGIWSSNPSDQADFVTTSRSVITSGKQAGNNGCFPWNEKPLDTASIEGFRSASSTMVFIWLVIASSSLHNHDPTGRERMVVSISVRGCLLMQMVCLQHSVWAWLGCWLGWWFGMMVGWWHRNCAIKKYMQINLTNQIPIMYIIGKGLFLSKR